MVSDCLDQDIDTNGAYDTLAVADSTTVLTNFSPKFGWEYILQRDAFTGTGSDSIAIEVRIDCKDRNGAVYQRYVLDTMTASAGEDILIPFMSLFLGEQFDVKFRTIGNAQGAGTQTIINRLKLWRRRAQTTAKSSNF